MHPITPLIIFGTRPRTTIVGDGSFVCPNCGGSHGYERHKVRNYFTLYFVPLIPLGEGEEFITCTHCGSTFTPDVLNANIKPKRKLRPLAEQLNRLQERLNDGLPTEYAIADLTAVGLDRTLAEQAVEQAITSKRRSCPQCGLTYALAVDQCYEDQAVLEQAV